MNYTKEQLDAINFRDRSLLVSAAAGSGKTATLTRRIIESILGGEDISRMLIVTFTNAAVDELKTRIKSALEAALKDNPDNKTLQRQLTLLPTANISTIDAFCRTVLAKNGDKVGAPLNYRIADAAEFELLAHATLKGLINAIYENEATEVASAEDFVNLSSLLTSSKKNSELEDVLLHLYEASKSAPEGVFIYRKLADVYLDENPLQSIYAKYACDYVHSLAEHFKNSISRIITELSFGDEREQNYARIFEGDLCFASALCDAKEYEEIRELLLNMSFKALPSYRNYEKNENQLMGIALRDELKKYAKSALEKFFFYPKDRWGELYSSLHGALSLLASVLEAFDRLYLAEKHKRGILEYSDVERYSYLVLYGEYGEINEVAESMRENFTSVYIDEYQDINALQGKIFDAISRLDNRFMVGDIKQSIYGFRSADPDVFASLKKAYPPLEKSSKGEGASIFMSRNFRSDEGIIDFANRVFDKIFGAVSESIGYVTEDRLSFSKDYGDLKKPPYRPAEFILVSGKKKQTDGDTETDSDGDDETDSARTAECHIVAEKIRELLAHGTLNNGERVRPKDIAIIIRRGKRRFSEYAAALDALGIPSVKTEDKEFFLNSEVLLALSLLNSINNPRKDIYLAGLLLSPIYNFTADELYALRRGRDGALYDCLLAYAAENPEWEKGSRFIRELDRYQTLAECMPTDAFILMLYKDTGLINLAKEKEKRAHLFLLYDYARRFGQSSYKGLYNFIRYINSVIDRGATLDSGIKEDGGDGVNIITVHGSKGLEYPIVFYVDTDAKYTDMDAKNRIAYSEKFGLSLCLFSEGNIALVDNPVQRIIRDFVLRSYKEEEFRVSYVALTRAREQLYIVGAVPEKYEEYLAACEIKGKFLDSFSVYNFTSALDFMLATAKDGAKISLTEAGAQEESAIAENKTEIYRVDDEGISAELLSQRFFFSYPDAHLTKVPEKISVSRLYPTVLDGSENDGEALLIDGDSQAPKARAALPEFYTGMAADISAKRGTATHLFMQFFNPELLLESGADAELLRLTEKGFISKEDSQLVRLSEIELFRKSDFFRELLSAKNIFREFRFNTRLKAKNFTKNPTLAGKLGEEEILVQGVIDCLLEDEEGKLHLVDYKTDRLSKEEQLDRELAAKSLSDKHARQLGYYSLAIERIFGKRPSTVRIYSLPLGDCVECPTLDSV